MIAATLFAFGNFYIVSELATSSHLAASQIKSQLRSVNPLLLLNNKHLMKLKGIYVDTLGSSRLGESASQLVVAMPSRSNEQINLLIAGNVQATSTEFNAENVSLLSTLDNKAAEPCPDRLLLENIAYTSISAAEFSQMVQKKIWNINNDHLKLPLLLVRLSELKNSYQTSPNDNHLRRSIIKVYTEIFRRFSVGFSLISFTLLGAACGMNIGRRQSIRGIIIVTALGALYLSTYFFARSFDHHLIPSLLLYSIPHLLIIGVSSWLLYRVNRGIE
jgi:lipopolysaccharide export system permease protein